MQDAKPRRLRLRVAGVRLSGHGPLDRHGSPGLSGLHGRVEPVYPILELPDEEDPPADLGPAASVQCHRHRTDERSDDPADSGPLGWGHHRAAVDESAIPNRGAIAAATRSAMTLWPSGDGCRPSPM